MVGKLSIIAAVALDTDAKGAVPFGGVDVFDEGTGGVMALSELDISRAVCSGGEVGDSVLLYPGNENPEAFLEGQGTAGDKEHVLPGLSGELHIMDRFGRLCQ